MATNDFVVKNGLVVNEDTTILDTTDSSSKDTGALIVEGGVGVEKNAHIGGDLTVYGGDATITNATGGASLTVKTTYGSSYDSIITVAGARTNNSTADIATLALRNETGSPYNLATIYARDPVGDSAQSKGTLNFTTANGSGPVLQMTIAETGNVTLTADLAVNGGDITTSATTFNLVNSTATTVNFASAATTLDIGATTGTTSINNNVDIDLDLNVDGGDITTNQTTFNLINANATTLNIGSAATTARLGANSGTLTIGNTTVVGLGATQTLWDTTATTINFGGAATTLNLGYDSTAASTTNINTGAVAASTTKTINIGTGGAASSTTNITLGATPGGTLTLNSPTVSFSGILTYTPTTGTVGQFNTIPFLKKLTSNGGLSFGADDCLIIGAGETRSTIETALSASLTTEYVYIGGENGVYFVSSPDNWASTWAGRQEMSWNGGVLTVGGDVAVNGGDITTNQTTFNLINATATTVNFAGAATTLTMAATTGTTNVRNNLDVDLDLNVDGGDMTTSATTFNLLNATATTVNAFGAATTIDIGATTGTTSFNHNVDIDLDLNVDGGDITTNAASFNLINANATTVNFAKAATSIDIGATTGTTSFNHNVDIDLDLNVDGGDITTNATTFNLINANATTINFGQASTTMSIGATTGTTTVRNSLSVDGDTTLGDSSADSVTINAGTLSTPNTITFGIDDATTAGISYPIKVQHTTSGTPATGIGVGVQFITETSASNNEIGMLLEAVTTDVVSATEDFDFSVKLMAAGAAAAEKFRVYSTGNGYFSGDLRVAGGDIYSAASTASTLFYNTTTGAVTIFGAQTSGNFVLGGTAATGSITIGRSSSSNTINIGAGATGSGNTQTINFGTGGATGSTTNINVGSAAGGTLTIDNPTITVNGQATFPSAIANRPILPGGYISMASGDADADLWGISEDYYPSHATAANAWGIRWAATPNEIQTVGNGVSRHIFDLDAGDFTTTGIITGGTSIAATTDITAGSTSRGADTFIRALAGDSNKAGFEAYGNSQGTGYLFVGQSATYGGGISYNGDGSPAFAGGETADYISFYRMDNGTRTVVFDYGYGANNVFFKGGIFTASGQTNAAGSVMRQRYDATDNYSAELGWQHLQLGNNGANYIIGGRTAAGGSLVFVTNQTNSGTSGALPTINGVTCLTLANGGTATFGTSSAVQISVDTTDALDFTANSTNDNRGISFNGRTAMSADYNDGYLRLNNGSEFSNGVYIPNYLGISAGANTTYRLTLGGSADGKIVMSGSTNPYIRFQESSTDRYYMQWNASLNAMVFYNQETRDHYFDTAATGNVAIKLNTAGTTRGWLYADSSNNVGILDEGGSWAIQHANDSCTKFYDAGEMMFEVGAGAATLGDYGTVVTAGSGKNSWEGYSINGRCVFMHDGSNAWGIYDDVNNQWMIYGTGFGTTRYVDLRYNGSVRLTTNNDGVDVTGLLTATQKSFLIDHPTKEGMKLQYACLEGPENGVYVRGKLEDESVIELPDYWLGLVHDDSITVNLTPCGPGQQLYVDRIEDNRVYVVNETGKPIKCFYTVNGERKDIDKLTVEK